MKLLFSIDALADSGKQAWRLQSDGKHWRTATFAESLQTTDWYCASVEEASEWHGRRLKKCADGLQPMERPGRFDFLVRGVFAHAVLHRLSSPPIPDKMQMQQQLSSHEAGTPWLLYLNLAGQFTMLDTRKTALIGNLHIAVRGEIASSAEFVGSTAAENSSLVDHLYHQFIAGWWEHLQHSRCGVFVPDVEKLKPVQEYLEDINNWQAEVIS